MCFTIFQKKVPPIFEETSKSAQGGNRTRTDLTIDRILSPVYFVSIWFYMV